jgi:aminobenzoyl-glutamate transport protein
MTGSAGSAREPMRGWLGRIERAGNALPDPVTLFALGAVLVFVGSWLAARLGWSCTLADAKGGERHELARNLLSADGLRWLATDLVPIYVGFRPLGLVLCASIGVAVAEKSGFLASALRAALIYVPKGLLTPATVLVGVCASLAADAGFVVLPPLAGAIYRSVGRPAALGIATVTAGVAGGFGANLFLTSLDPLLAGMTEQAARLVDPEYVVSAACNWHFMAVSTVLLTLVGWFVAERVLAPRLAGTTLDAASAKDAVEDVAMAPRERRALAIGVGVLVALLALFVVARVAPGGFLHDPPPVAGKSPQPVWIQSIVALIVALFFAPGLAYGIAAGTIRSDRDVARMLSEYFGVLANYIVLAFFAAILVAAFERSNLGILLAVEGADVLSGLALPKALLLTAFVLLTATVNLLIISSSAKWALLATIFVPLFMRLGVSPELTQVAYRVGDSLTNPISPLNMYLVIVLSFLRRHDETSGLGTLISLLMPFTVAFTLAWIPLLLVWVALGIPLGPGGALVYPLGG